ncbi:MAG: hypothetical protein AABX17_01450 [Nanoarchaeota archaeon]
MANDTIIPFRNQSGISAYNAFDALAQVNPEMAAMAWAHKDGLLQPEMMPYYARFRELDVADRRNLLDFAVEKIRIGADVEMNYDNNKTVLGVTHMREDGATRRTEITDKGKTVRALIHENGATERTDLECRAAVDVSRMKYEADVRIMQDHMDGMKYLSDNELRAKHIEASALQKAMQIHALVETIKSNDRRMEIIQKAEFEYLAEVRKAELLRDTARGKRDGEIVSNYLAVQAHMYQLYLQHELALAIEKKEGIREVYSALAIITTKALEDMARAGINGIVIEADTAAGQFKYKITRENDKK